MLYWTLFAVFLFPDGKIDYDSGSAALNSFETRLQCEVVKARLLTMLPPSERHDLRCIRTDEV